MWFYPITKRWIPSVYHIYIIVSDVGLIAIGSFNTDYPDLVTHATSGENPSTWSFSVFNALSLTNIGK